MKKSMVYASLLFSLVLTACQKTEDVQPVTKDPKPVVQETATAEREPIKEEKTVIHLSKNLKNKGNTNPVMTQAFGADPYAMVYDDTIYLYMTADAFEYDAQGEIVENSYGKIKSIHVLSTKDMKNFTDYGEIDVAGTDGIATWAHNSWAPAACWKNIDGVDKFFLYFADNGGGIGVLEGETPYGPFKDPLGHALISRNVPNCNDVLWLFDPAVLVDDDGTGYIYFGGGVPEGKAAAPGTGRCARLGADMISLDGDPVRMDVPYLFEDSGIHKFNDKYYYTYCSNWTVDQAGTDQYGMTSGQICCMESDSPLGPFTYKEMILANPGTLCGLWGNNHHCVFSFRDKWYITYHSRQLEKSMGIEHGYRSTFINEFTMQEDGSIGVIKQSVEGPDQLSYVDAYSENAAVCVSSMAGSKAVGADDFAKEHGYGHMAVSVLETGNFVAVDGVDFKEQAPKQITINASVPEGVSGKVHVRLDFAGREDIAVVDLAESNGFKAFTASVDTDLTGVHNLYLVFEGEGYLVDSYTFA